MIRAPWGMLKISFVIVLVLLALTSRSIGEFFLDWLVLGSITFVFSIIGLFLSLPRLRNKFSDDEEDDGELMVPQTMTLNILDNHMSTWTVMCGMLGLFVGLMTVLVAL